MDTTEQYLIADSKARMAALRRAPDEETRDRILAAIRRNSYTPKRKTGSRHGSKPV